MQTSLNSTMTKVPAVTLGFWAIKILATTFGETAGDTVSMSMNLGYLLGTGIFATLLVFLVTLQIKAKQFHPFLYWATIIASTTAGTTMADFATRSLGIGYTGGSLLLFALVMVSLAVWKANLGSVSVDSVATTKAEIFYWITITLSQTLGTALGDWLAGLPGMGYLAAAGVFAAGLAITWALYRWSSVSHVLLFWAAFILTRPLGATVGDFLDKPLDKGGLDLSRPIATLVLGVAIAALILLLPQRAGGHPSSSTSQ